MAQYEYAMPAFPQFFGNDSVAQTLGHMIQEKRIAQTILLSGPEGVGKATLARRFAAAILEGLAAPLSNKIELDDLSLPINQSVLEERDKWTSEKRNDDPLLFSSHPDFITFAPDGPLRQITIQQIRLLRERAQLKPLRGSRRVFLIDRVHRANEQAANSLLKVLEEPPEHLVILATAENLYDLLPTIRSRSIVFQLGRLQDEDMRAFVSARGLPDAEMRVALAEGSPGIAATLDLEDYRQRRELALTALECGAGVRPFADWIQVAEPFSMRRSEKLDLYLKVLYSLLNDILRVACGQPLPGNRDAFERIYKIADRVTFSWIEHAVADVDQLVEMVRRNIQKTAALDAFVVSLRGVRIPRAEAI